MAEKRSIMFTEGGLWNTRRPQPSTETSRLLKTLDDEARINSFQYSQLTGNMLRGASLSTKSELSSIQSQALINKRTKPIRPSKLPKPSLRTYNDIVNSGAYNQPDYHPKPIKTRSDEEKDRLANLMAYGIDPTKMPVKSISDSPPPPSREIDRFDELVLEVEERKKFLDQMAVLGKGKEYQLVISNEIADKIREMEQIDRQRSKALERRLNERS